MGTMSGILDYYKKAKGGRHQAILGMEHMWRRALRFDRDPAKDKARFHLTILSMNLTGFHNLVKLSTKANLEGMYYKPRIES